MNKLGNRWIGAPPLLHNRKVEIWEYGRKKKNHVIGIVAAPLLYKWGKDKVAASTFWLHAGAYWAAWHLPGGPVCPASRWTDT